ncbi:hypothetical protein HDU97_003972 [Phlyctochytrium planicorne]|nr:hypothetical protein HDU97_003972 [Phlyctochytrium planicorne]
MTEIVMEREDEKKRVTAHRIQTNLLPHQQQLYMLTLPLHTAQPSPTSTPPPYVPLFPQRHPKRSLVCIFLLLISGARLSSILNHQRHSTHSPFQFTNPSILQQTSLPHGFALSSDHLMASDPLAGKVDQLNVSDNLAYRSHLMPPELQASNGPSSSPAQHVGTDKPQDNHIHNNPSQPQNNQGSPSAQHRSHRHPLVQEASPAGQEDKEAAVLQALLKDHDLLHSDEEKRKQLCESLPQACVGGSTLAYVPQPSLSKVSNPSRGMRFVHGVASGDALSDAVITVCIDSTPPLHFSIWTRVTPPTSQDPLKLHPSFPVRFDVSLTTKGFDSSLPGNPPTDLGDGPLLMSGVVVTGPEVDYTVKVDLTSLQPGTTYYYRFSVTSPSLDPLSDEEITEYSPTGMTRTLPSSDPNAPSFVQDKLGFAVVSCSNLPAGFFNAYSSIAARPEVDFVVHLGDYLYEYRNGEYGDGTDIGRVPIPDRELVTLEDYRIRHAQYKQDPDLQALHRVKPWYVIWDDHEFIDNVSGKDEAAWDSPRIPSALRAYFEYLPIRETQHTSKDSASTSKNAIYRSFQFGSLMDLILLDTRIEGRDLSGVSNVTVMESPERTILGSEQEKWLQNELETSKERGTKWRFLGNQVVFAPIDHWGLNINLDAWDGYPANRKRVLDHLVEKNIDNVVVLTGDIHTSLAFDVPIDPWDPKSYNPKTGEGSHLVELVSPSVTSPSPLESIRLGFLNSFGESLLLNTEPHLKFADLSRRGYMLLKVTSEMVKCEYWYPQGSIRIKRKPGEEILGASVETLSGSGKITKMDVYPKSGRKGDAVRRYRTGSSGTRPANVASRSMFERWFWSSS